MPKKKPMQDHDPMPDADDTLSEFQSAREQSDKKSKKKGKKKKKKDKEFQEGQDEFFDVIDMDHHEDDDHHDETQDDHLVMEGETTQGPNSEGTVFYDPTSSAQAEATLDTSQSEPNETQTDNLQGESNSEVAEKTTGIEEPPSDTEGVDETSGPNLSEEFHDIIVGGNEEPGQSFPGFPLDSAEGEGALSSGLILDNVEEGMGTPTMLHGVLDAAMIQPQDLPADDNLVDTTQAEDVVTEALTNDAPDDGTQKTQAWDETHSSLSSGRTSKAESSDEPKPDEQGEDFVLSETAEERQLSRMPTPEKGVDTSSKSLDGIGETGRRDSVKSRASKDDIVERSVSIIKEGEQTEKIPSGERKSILKRKSIDQEIPPKRQSSTAVPPKHLSSELLSHKQEDSQLSDQVLDTSQAQEEEAGEEPHEDCAAASEMAPEEDSADQGTEAKDVTESEEGQDGYRTRKSKVEFDVERKVMLIDPLELTSQDNSELDSEGPSQHMPAQDVPTASGEGSHLASENAEDKVSTSEAIIGTPGKAGETTIASEIVENKSYSQHTLETTGDDPTSSGAGETLEMSDNLVSSKQGVSEADTEMQGLAGETGETERGTDEVGEDLVCKSGKSSHEAATAAEALSEDEMTKLTADECREDAVPACLKSANKERQFVTASAQSREMIWPEYSDFQAKLRPEDEREWQFIKDFVGEVLALAYCEFKEQQKEKAEKANKEMKGGKDRQSQATSLTKLIDQYVADEQMTKGSNDVCDSRMRSSVRLSQLQHNLWSEPIHDICGKQSVLTQHIMDYCKQKYLDPVFCPNYKQKPLKNDVKGRASCSENYKITTICYPDDLVDKSQRNRVTHNNNGWSGRSPRPYHRSGSFSHSSRARSRSSSCDDNDSFTMEASGCTAERQGGSFSKSSELHTHYSKSKTLSEKTKIWSSAGTDFSSKVGAVKTRLSTIPAGESGLVSDNSQKRRSASSIIRRISASLRSDSSPTRCPPLVSISPHRLKQLNNSENSDSDGCPARSQGPSFSTRSSRRSDVTPTRINKSWHSLGDNLTSHSPGRGNGALTPCEDNDDKLPSMRSPHTDELTRTRGRGSTSGYNGSQGSESIPCSTTTAPKKHTRWNCCGGQFTVGPYVVTKVSSRGSLGNTKKRSCTTGCDEDDDNLAGTSLSRRPTLSKLGSYDKRPKSTSPGPPSRLDASSFPSQRGTACSSARQSPQPFANASGSRPFSQSFQPNQQLLTPSQQTRPSEILDARKSPHQYAVETLEFRNSQCRSTRPSSRLQTRNIGSSRNTVFSEERPASRGLSSGQVVYPSHLSPGHFSGNASPKKSQFFGQSTSQDRPWRSSMRMSTGNSRERYTDYKSPSRGASGLPSQGASGFPSRGASVLPSQGASGLPSRGASGLPSRGASGLPSRGASGFPSRGTSGLPSRGTSGLPSRGTSPSQYRSSKDIIATSTSSRFDQGCSGLSTRNQSQPSFPGRLQSIQMQSCSRGSRTFDQSRGSRRQSDTGFDDGIVFEPMCFPNSLADVRVSGEKSPARAMASNSPSQERIRYDSTS